MGTIRKALVGAAMISALAACSKGEGAKVDVKKPPAPSGGAMGITAAAGRLTAGGVTMDATVGVPLGPMQAGRGTLTLRDATLAR